MADKVCRRSIRGTRRDEMTMREVLDGMNDIATMLSYDPWPGEFEIIALHPPGQDTDTPRECTVIKKERPLPASAEIIPYPGLKLSA